MFEPEPSPLQGMPGAADDPPMERAAHHDHGSDGDDRRAVRRAERRWGMDRLRLIHGEPAGDEPEGDELEDLARVLHRALRHQPVVLLHDRRVEGASIIDHLAIGPGGVTVIGATRELRPPLCIARLSGVFGARAEGLHDAAGDQTARIVALREQVFAIRRHLDDVVTVKGALCPQFPGVTGILPLDVGGILVGDAKAVAQLAAREGHDAELNLAALVDEIDRTLEPVFGRPR